jgi:hypothetical protein
MMEIKRPQPAAAPLATVVGSRIVGQQVLDKPAWYWPD